MRRSVLVLCALLVAILHGTSAVSMSTASIGTGSDEPWPLPTGDPRGPDGVYGPELPDPQHRLQPGDAAAGLLGREVPQSGPGQFETLPGTIAVPETEGAGVQTVWIGAEQNLDVDIERFGQFVLDTLNDERGWSAVQDVSFAPAEDRAEADIVVRLATPDTVDDLCAPVPTGGTYSCGTLSEGAVLNALRWTEGTSSFLTDGATATDYRHYLVNHEVGHLLGHGHVSCPGEGAPAPVMVQQSISLDGCTANGWVVPD